MMNKKVIVPLAEGFEEIEALTIVDILRRANVDVTMAAVGSLHIKEIGRASCRERVSSPV